MKGKGNKSRNSKRYKYGGKENQIQKYQTKKENQKKNDDGENPKIER